jgi:LacI family transcriptional regulator
VPTPRKNSRPADGPPSIRDVAAAAGVSIATVSRVLNRPGDVAPDTLAIVRKVIKDLGYVPNPLAQAIASRESHLIGLAVPRFHGEFMTWLLHGADEEANRLGYHLMMTTIAVSDDGHARRHIVGSNLIDALLVVITETEDHLAHDVVQSGLPTVVIDTDMSGKGLDSVVLDNERGTREAVEHLLRWVEPKSLYFVGGPRTNFDSVERMRAFRAALGEVEAAAAGRARGKENGNASAHHAAKDTGKDTAHEIAEDDERVAAGAYSIEWGKEWGIRMIEKLGLGAAARGADAKSGKAAACVGVLAGNDKIACGIMQAAEDAGVKVPEQLRVVGFNDSHLSRIVRPNLSTVSLPMKELGALAVRHLVRRMEDPKAEVLCTKLPTKLIVRESSTARNF